jgi:hypothetical protein
MDSLIQCIPCLGSFKPQPMDLTIVLDTDEDRATCGVSEGRDGFQHPINRVLHVKRNASFELNGQALTELKCVGVAMSRAIGKEEILSQKRPPGGVGA